MENIDLPTLKILLELKPEDQIKYLKSKGFGISDGWKATLKIIQKNGFTIAQITKMDLLMDIRELIVKAMNEGMPIEDFRKQFRNLLKKSGWYQEPKSKLQQQLDTNWRLNQILRQNVSGSFHAGRFEGTLDGADRFPYVREVVINDSKTEIKCKYRANNKFTFRITDKLLKWTYPPSHFGCRKISIPVNESLVKTLGLRIKKVALIPKMYWNATGFNRLPNTQFKPDLSKYPDGLKSQFKGI